MDLNQIDLGRLDAESDTKLADYFVETGASLSIARGKQLVLGRKGTGKTALFVHLKDKFASQSTVVDLDLNEYLFSTHRALRESGVSESSSYTSAWKLLIYTAALGSVSSHLTSSEKRSFTRILDELQMADKHGRFAGITEWLRRVKRVELPSLSGFGSLGSVELDNTPDGFLGADFIDSVIDLERLALSVMEREPIVVLIDQIDEVWDGSEESKNFIVGALKAMRFINLRPSAGEAANVIIFLRTDLWDQVVFNDRNKISQDIEYLNWDDEALIEVVEARIASSPGWEDKSWFDAFFDGEMRQRASSKTYVLKRTMGRPRDIVAYATFALEEAVRQGHEQILAEDIYSSETRYSAHVVDELKDEMASALSQLPRALAVFKSIGRRNFDWANWFEHASNQGFDEPEARELLTRLFEASVVGVFEVGGGGGGSRSRYRYQDSYLHPIEDRLMQVHLAVAKELGLKDS